MRTARQMKATTAAPNPANVLRRLSKPLFWDCDAGRLDPDADKRLILERVFTRGTEADEREVFGYYGRALIRQTVTEIKYLDKKSLNYLSVILDIPKEDFRCYEKTLSENPFGIS